MIQRWAAVCGQEGTLHKLLEQFLTDRNMELEQVLNSDEMKDELLEQLFPECLNMLQGSTTTGIFVVLTGEETGLLGIIQLRNRKIIRKPLLGNLYPKHAVYLPLIPQRQ